MQYSSNIVDKPYGRSYEMPKGKNRETLFAPIYAQRDKFLAVLSAAFKTVDKPSPFLEVKLK